MSAAVPIAINGRFLTQSTTGVQRYAIELVRALDRELDGDDRWRFELVGPRGMRSSLPLAHIRQRSVGRLSGHAWEQLELPLHVRGRFLVSLCNAAPLLKRAQLVTVHDAAVFDRPDGFSFAFRTWYRAMLRGLGRTARQLVTVSRFSRDRLSLHCNLPADRLALVHEGADHVHAVPPDRRILERERLRDKPYLLLVGTLDPRKNVSVVMRALPHLAAHSFDTVVVGGTNPSVFGVGAALPPGRVRYLGKVSDAELRALYEEAACFVFPSLYEGFGLPPVEALACGCPTVVARTAALLETCGDAVLCFDPHDPRDAAAVIGRVLADASLREEMRARGRARVEQLTWRRCARELLALLAGLVSSPGARAS
ncbi:MAG TPA: glycosyltransferase family 1 protein [Polyangia bacterium]|jgi:glycosyltransferase involved in cell wall biosynthesis